MTTDESETLRDSRLGEGQRPTGRNPRALGALERLVDSLVDSGTVSAAVALVGGRRSLEWSRAVGWARDGPGRFMFVRSLQIPYWLPALIFACAPALAIARRFQQFSTTRKGLCRRCGYDLRATPKRCPECGEVPIRSSLVAT